MIQTIDFNAMLPNCDPVVPPINILEEDDSYTLEWIFKDVRIGVTVDKKADEHGWWVVSKQITASGPLEL